MQVSNKHVVHEAQLPRDHVLYRPRHGRRQTLALVCALIFLVTPALLWFTGVRSPLIENRPSHEFPSLSEGWKFFTGLTSWATDQLPFRADAIRAADGVSQSIFGESIPRDNGALANGPLPGSSSGPVPELGPLAELNPGVTHAGQQKVIEGRDGWLYFGADAEFKCTPVRPVNETMTKLNQLREIVERSGRTFVYVVAPDKTTMLPQYLPSTYANKDCSEKVRDYFWSEFINTGHSIDVRPSLSEAGRQAGKPIYPDKDTHWTDEGSIAFTREIAEHLRPGISAGWKIESAGEYTIGADLPPLLGREGTKTNLRYKIHPDGVTNRTADSARNIDNPVQRQSVPVRGMITAPTLVFGDSFTEASSKYLGAAFSDLTMLAYQNASSNRQIAVDAFVNSEVVVIENVERMASLGALSFVDDDFMRELDAQLAKNPIR